MQGAITHLIAGVPVSELGAAIGAWTVADHLADEWRPPSTDVRAVGRRPRTGFRLIPNGHQAFQAHVAWLQQAVRVRPEDAADDTAAPAPSAVHTTNERG